MISSSVVPGADFSSLRGKPKAFPVLLELAFVVVRRRRNASNLGNAASCLTVRQSQSPGAPPGVLGRVPLSDFVRRALSVSAFHFVDNAWIRDDRDLLNPIARTEKLFRGGVPERDAALAIPYDPGISGEFEDLLRR